MSQTPLNRFKPPVRPSQVVEKNESESDSDFDLDATTSPTTTFSNGDHDEAIEEEEVLQEVEEAEDEEVQAPVRKEPMITDPVTQLAKVTFTQRNGSGKKKESGILLHHKGFQYNFECNRSIGNVQL